MIAIPASLTLLRLFLGPLALWLAFLDAPRTVYAWILVGGLLSDYFDGALARRLGVAREWLRRLDSTVDVIYHLFLLGTAWVLAPDTLHTGLWAIILMLLGEVICIAVSMARFRRLPATHAYSAKLYGIVLFIVIMGVMCFAWGSMALWICCAFSLIANAEILAILLLSSEPPVDVSSVLKILRHTPASSSERND